MEFIPLLSNQHHHPTIDFVFNDPTPPRFELTNSGICTESLGDYVYRTELLGAKSRATVLLGHVLASLGNILPD